MRHATSPRTLLPQAWRRLLIGSGVSAVAALVSKILVSNHLATREALQISQAAIQERAIASTRHQLLEALGARIASDLLAADARIDEVTVWLRKLRPPVTQPLRTSGVRLTRGRS